MNPTSFEHQLANSLSWHLSGSFAWLSVLAIAWCGGLLTAFTPCNYPVLPLILRYFAVSSEKQHAHSVTQKIAAYTFGLVFIYTTLGVIFASTHRIMGQLWSRPFFLWSMALFCLLMGASTFGLFSLQLPATMHTAFARIDAKRLSGAFGMGMVSGALAAPCTGPVLAVILSLIAKDGRIYIGFLTMLFFSLGIATPLAALAFFWGRWHHLPRATYWVRGTQSLLAAGMFIAAGYFAWLARDIQQVSQISKDKQTIVWHSDHDKAIQYAQQKQQPALIDFTAEWCSACKDLDENTYTDPFVQQTLQRFVSIRIDATQLDDNVEKLLGKYQIVGLPTLVFIDQKGHVLHKPRPTGFIAPKEFVMLLQSIP